MPTLPAISPRRLALLTATAVLLPLGAVSAATPVAGSRGVGDPYYPDYGNGGYDVAHYAIDVTYTPGQDRLVGRTTLTARATESLKQFNLDLVLPASKVTVNGLAATFRQGPHELVVRPASAVPAGTEMSVQVDYAGRPSSVSSHGISPWILTATGVAAVGEPEIAAWWYAANDHPRDKATYDVAVSVPQDLEVLSNGRLVSNAVTGDQRVWRWRESQPMAPYLADFVVGQFDIKKRTTASGLPVITAVEGSSTPSGRRAAADLARTPEVIDFETGLWGPYPFDAVGGVAPDSSFGFALENQTRPTYARGFWEEGRDVYVVVHENAHQWFGDSVSVENWRDIWLNEGFATFTEWMWSERHDEGSAAQLFASIDQRTPATSRFWRTTIGDPGKGNEFDDAVYDRGAMTLQALRTRIGEADFFTVMRTWVADHRYGNASIADFTALAEQVSGQDLDEFFRVWLYTGSKPAPTADNGFPPGARSGQRVAAPASLVLIDRVREASQAARR